MSTTDNILDNSFSWLHPLEPVLFRLRENPGDPLRGRRGWGGEAAQRWGVEGTTGACPASYILIISPILQPLNGKTPETKGNRVHGLAEYRPA